MALGPLPSRPVRVLAALAASLLLGAALAPGQPARAEGAGTGGGRGPASSGPSVHSSDGRPGPVAAPVSRARLAASATISRRAGWTVAPGVTYRRWDRTDARGTLRAHLLTADLATEGLALDYASFDLVRQRGPLTSLLARDAAVAGVNGDFFDIDDTGAPLGVGRDRQIGMRNAPAYGWNNTFSIGADGTPRIGTLAMTGSVAERPRVPLTNVNSPTVRPGGVGVYTRGWGTTAGRRVTDGQRRHVREVVVRRGVVRSNEPVLSQGQPVTGLVLVGRGAGADALARMRVGTRATITWGLEGAPAVAISGSTIVLSDGVVTARDDRELHPRTAVGIDRDTGDVLLLVVDGRQSFSRGATLVELGRMMRRLGAEDALNLDGGGSSTMVAANRSGVVGVRNSPSDGAERPVPNGLELTYTPPAP
ncbi:MAG TPA: phosphodiester glycosidase family protein [Nocardioides sp.]|uniref:phosphodiester glycosidase family protein n=1 Tax=Nocardioides sp. TaxID=35761 RepID=UPI002C47F51C|nr:phosphodiester glycosidase family protein [Nocardioides sp.]HQR27653.1 phosphodiester glycosidase family protein [Nocardioides sp.]